MTGKTWRCLIQLHRFVQRDRFELECADCGLIVPDPQPKPTPRPTYG